MAAAREGEEELPPLPDGACVEAVPAAGCETAFCGPFKVELSVACKPVGTKHTPVTRTSRSTLVMLPDDFKPFLSIF